MTRSAWAASAALWVAIRVAFAAARRSGEEGRASRPRSRRSTSAVGSSAIRIGGSKGQRHGKPRARGLAARQMRRQGVAPRAKAHGVDQARRDAPRPAAPASASESGCCLGNREMGKEVARPASGSRKRGRAARRGLRLGAAGLPLPSAVTYPASGSSSPLRQFKRSTCRCPRGRSRRRSLPAARQG